MKVFHRDWANTMRGQIWSLKCIDQYWIYDCLTSFNLKSNMQMCGCVCSVLTWSGSSGARRLPHHPGWLASCCQIPVGPHLALLNARNEVENQAHSVWERQRERENDRETKRDCWEHRPQDKLLLCGCHKMWLYIAYFKTPFPKN